MLWSILLNSYHGNNDRYENFDFNFCYVLPSRTIVQSFVTINWQKKLLIIKLFNFFCF